MIIEDIDFSDQEIANKIYDLHLNLKTPRQIAKIVKLPLPAILIFLEFSHNGYYCCDEDIFIENEENDEELSFDDFDIDDLDEFYSKEHLKIDKQFEMNKNRKCKICGKKLSAYNNYNECWSHSENQINLNDQKTQTISSQT